MSAGAVVGVSDHGGWAVFVTADRAGSVLDRRRVVLVDEGLPAIPHHCEAQTLPPDEAVALIEQVRASAERHANEAFAALEAELPVRILGIALRECPELPPTIVERFTDYRARNVADWVMYRRALAEAAASRGWPVHWYNSSRVIQQAGESLANFAELRRILGPPWTQDHRLALSAAIAVGKLG